MSNMVIIRTDVTLEHADRVIIDHEDKVWTFFFSEGTPPALLDLTIFTESTRDEVNRAMQQMFGW